MTTTTEPAPPSLSSFQASNDPCALVSRLLQNTANPTVLSTLCTPDCTFVSITYTNPALTAILPFAGRHVREGPQAILDTFATVDAIWLRTEFTIDTLFSGPNRSDLGSAVFGHSGFAETDPADSVRLVDVALFGSFTLQARTTGKVVRSPYCVWCKVDMGAGRVVYMQYMEDTLGTTSVLKCGEAYGRFSVFPGRGEFEV